MRQALEGSHAIAVAVGLCRPGVVAAYPITPQTHIVENISKLVADGDLKTEMVSVESEFSAASVALGAASAGSRAYTASSSQGIMLMAEVLFNISGLRVPMVLTCANRAVGAPLNIWNDHQDSMSVRDSGWIQLYCADNQEAVDTTIQAFRISEKLELPVMVCLDGFTLTHTMEVVDIPTQKQVDSYLPAYTFSRTLDSTNPVSIGTVGTPDVFTEVRHAHHNAMLRAEKEIIAADKAWKTLTGRTAGGILETRGDPDAKIGILSIGSVVGTMTEAIAELSGKPKVKLIKLRCFRPFPAEALKAACEGLTDLIVLERALSPGMGGIVGTEIKAVMAELRKPPRVHNYAAGLGGRDLPLDLAPRLVKAAAGSKAPERFTIFDADVGKLAPEDR